MSALSVSASSQSLSQYLQRLAANSQSTSTAGTTTATAATNAATTAVTSAPLTGTQSASGAGHHHGHGALFKKIEAAVTQALDAAKSDPSADPDQVMKDAIEKVFQDADSTTATAADATATDATTTDATATTSDDSAHQAFLDALKAHGVDFSQFRQDFQAAIKEARSGDAQTATALKSFPPGSSVNEVA